MFAPNMGDAAVSVARGYHQSGYTGWHGLCLAATRTYYGIAPKYATALDAWNGAAKKHHTSTGANVPRGAPVFWGVGDGHIAIATGNGFCWSTDIFTYGGVDMARIDFISLAWGKPLLGWSEDLNGVTAWVAPKPPPALEVSLSHVETAARLDPNRDQGGTTEGAYFSVLRTERMLAVEGRMSWAWVDGSFGTKTRESYAAYQRSLGYRGADANGVPGNSSLGALCQRHKMHMVT